MIFRGLAQRVSLITHAWRGIRRLAIGRVVRDAWWPGAAQDDQGDAGDDDRADQQRRGGDVLAEQPPAQEQGDEGVDERVGAGELAGGVADEPLVGAVGGEAAEDDQVREREGGWRGERGWVDAGGLAAGCRGCDQGSARADHLHAGAGQRLGGLGGAPGVDPLEAVSAVRAAQSGRAAGAPRGRDGQVEAICALMVAKRTARAQRTQTINQARALIVTRPDDIRARFTRHGLAELVVGLAALRPRPGSMVRYHTLLSLRELGHRAQYLDGQLELLDELIVPW
jgi:hypothetical protein